MWTLVYIIISASSVEAIDIGKYDTMNDCFQEREILVKLASIASEDKERLPPGLQAVCVRGYHD